MLLLANLKVSEDNIVKLPTLDLGFTLELDPRFGHLYRSNSIVVAPYTGEVYLDIAIRAVGPREIYVLSRLAKIEGWYKEVDLYQQQEKRGLLAQDPFGIYYKVAEDNNK